MYRQMSLRELLRMMDARAQDVSSAVHEMLPVFRRALARLADETADAQLKQMIRTLETYAGVKGGKWTREAEEKIARAGRRLLRPASTRIAALPRS